MTPLERITAWGMGVGWGRDGEAREATVTLDKLYSLYRHTYCEHENSSSRSLPCCNGLPALARAVAEFAETDAQDGKPMRSFPEFQLALALGAGALGPLGWTAG